MERTQDDAVASFTPCLIQVDQRGAGYTTLGKVMLVPGRQTLRHRGVQESVLRDETAAGELEFIFEDGWVNGGPVVAIAGTGRGAHFDGRGGDSQWRYLLRNEIVVQRSNIPLEPLASASVSVILAARISKLAMRNGRKSKQETNVR